MYITTNAIIKNIEIQMSELEMIEHIFHNEFGERSDINILYVKDDKVCFKEDISYHGSPCYVERVAEDNKIKAKKLDLLKQLYDIYEKEQIKRRKGL